MFDLDKYYINPRAAKELRKVYAAMVRYPNLNIFIASHTDSRGSNEYNNRLSINRAISTKNWLVRRGIKLIDSQLTDLENSNWKIIVKTMLPYVKKRSTN